MSEIYLDTSGLVALAFAERGGKRIARRLESATAVYSSNLLEAEFRSVLVREGVDDGALLEPIRWVVPDRPLSGEFDRVLDAGYVRGADLWHLACALFVEPEPHELVFLTLDRRQRNVARLLGFPTS
ncbi:MAG: type II toxin-antitoxin system VapC family toxin [Gemmatimonadota bacterium]|nr:MAG: type II toxin-antitoxin system VapC family toxin [Gemmatimonadota bacterium]